ncbi:Rhs element Vgr protein [Nostoc commune NIES-4072]|uniref:Rhs element Vgr protein n=1 Tax=Nostoc commune NIES-4072 TaxID=2005467 RepID=A0A2R5G4S2_NOSCO|nr:VgrG-related protein [Nostoc commune]BBD70131.1 Rhs element Vgr protein [Nostoc commune HK-02]GBG22784.1 Rhs element Vgr protein [Nostoc commune NIES-4072]
MGTYSAEPILQIDNKDASAALLEDILQISVEESLHQPGMFTLVIRNDYFPGRQEDTAWRYQDLFTIGKSIKIGFKSSTTQAQEFSEQGQGYILEGEITAIETQFNSESQAPLIIRGYDISHRLHRGRFNRSYQNAKDSDIAKKIAGEVGISIGTVDDSGGPHGFDDPPGYIFQKNQTNMEFLHERAARIGFELFVQDNKLHFRKPTTGDTLNLQWLKNIHSLAVRVTSAEQINSVQVRAWDYSQKQAIVSNKNAPQVVTQIDFGKGNSTNNSFNGKPNSPTMVIVDRPVSTIAEADAIAQGICNEIAGEFVHADGKGEGNPLLRTGKVIKLEGMGKYNGKYYVTQTRHLYQEGNYITEFSVRGLRGNNWMPRITQSNLQPGQTLLVGIVTDNNDPQKWGRVKVKFPTLTEDHQSNWARVVGAGAAGDRGFDCLPEINDEVLVAFEHGDIHRPYVIGGVWNGKDAPPETVDKSVVDGKVRLRTFKTRLGHKLQFVEEDKDSSKSGCYLETTKAHKFHMNDSDKFVETKTTDGHYVRLDDKDKKIEIKTKNGHQVLMDDMGKNIKIKTTGGHQIMMDDMGKKIEIKTPNGQKITMSDTSNSINIEAVQKINIKAPMEIKLESGPSSIKIAPGGIEMQTPAKISAQAGGMLDFKAVGTANMKAGAAMSLQSGAALSVQAGASCSVQSGAALNLQAGAAAALMAAVTASVTAPLIRLNC